MSFSNTPRRARSNSIESLESRRLMAGDYPLAINFNDEATSTSHYSTSVSQAESLGISAVRLWHSATWGASSIADGSKSLQRAFDLHDRGFNVLLVVQAGENKASTKPSSASQVSAYFDKLLNFTEPGGSRKLKDVVDRWEVGNEVNLDKYFVTNGDDNNYKPRLKDYVDLMLTPAAQTLHNAGEKVVTAGIAWGGTGPLDYMLSVTPASTKANIDFIGFHPYVTASNQASIATSVRASVDKYTDHLPILATEWNVKDKSVYSGNYSGWATAINSAFRNTARDAYDTTYYFALIDNEQIKNGQGAHRPAGLLRHSTENSSTTPLVANENFYDMFDAWQDSSITGYVWDDVDGDRTLDAGEGKLSGRVAYLDLDGDSVKDTNEPSATTNGSGQYTLNYHINPHVSGGVAPGTYWLRQVVPSGSTATTNSLQVAVTAAATTTGQNFGVRSTTTPPTPGTISGYYFGDTNGNGAWDTGIGESGQSGKTMYIDEDEDGVLDSGEPSVLTDSAGLYMFTNLDAGVYRIRRSGLPAGYRFTLPEAGFRDVTLAAGATVSNSNFAGTTNVLLAGTAYDDANGDGVLNGAEAGLSGKTVFVDADADGVLDAGETSATTDASGNWRITSLAAGTYSLRVVPGAGYVQTQPASGPISVTVGSGGVASDRRFGLRTISNTASISGQYFGDSNSNGVKDAGETGQSGKQMFLDADDDGVLDAGETSVLTDGSGNYAFTGLAAGSYNVRRNGLPAGYRLSTPSTGVYQIVLSANETSTGNDFGTTTKSTISGNYWGDENGDGIWNVEDEDGQEGKWMYLDIDLDGTLDVGEPTAVTDAGGYYAFFNLNAGTYRVRRDGLPAGYRISSAPSGYFDVPVGTAAVAAGVDFGTTSRALITGTIFNDANNNGIRDTGESGLSGWTVFVDDDNDGVLDEGEESVLSAADGSYSLSPTAGTRVIRALTAAGWTRTTPSAGYHSVTVTAAQSVSNKSFGFKL